MKNYKFTIFTPCYNGENTIERVFESVSNQTYTNFEWIIVNDGSKDNSRDKIVQLRKKYPHIDNKIIYLEQENKGKHMAWNRGADVADSDLWLSADCDDSFVPTTLEYFNEKINQLPDIKSGVELKGSIFSGVNVCVYNPDNSEMIGNPYPYNGLVSDNVELQYKYHIKGEHWGIVRTDLLKKHKFPNGKGHFWTEGRLWFTFAKLGYKVVCYNDCLRAYFYEPLSLTNNKRHKFNKDITKMYLYNDIWVIRQLGWRIFKYSPKGFLLLCIRVFKLFVKMVLVPFVSI